MTTAIEIDRPQQIADLIAGYEAARIWSVFEAGDLLEAGREWARFGFSPRQVQRWLNVGVYNPDNANDFHNAGIAPSMVERWYFRGQWTIGQAASEEVAPISELIELAAA